MAFRTGTERRGSFLDAAAKQGRRMSLIESAAQYVQHLATGNHSLSVFFHYGYVGAAVGGLAVLLFFVPFFTLLAVLSLMAILIIAVDFLIKWDAHWTLKVALKQYLMTKVFIWYGCYQSWKFHRKSFDVRKWQEETLMYLLKANLSSEYSQTHNLPNVRNSLDFVRIHPLTKFADYAPYIERMKNGESNVLTSEDPIYFVTTSGTTGVPSIIPFTKWLVKNQMGLFGLFSFNTNKYLPWEKSGRLRPQFKLNYTHPGVLKDTKFPGVQIGPFTNNPMFKKMGQVWTSPTRVFDIPDMTVGTYVQILFALRYRELGVMDGTFASNVYFVFKRMEAEWRSLVQDIRIGKINKNLDVPQDIRGELEAVLEPDPARADELETEFEKGFEDIAHRIWPELVCILCITTGPFAIYHQYLRKNYVKGPEINLFSMAFAATEGFFGCNFWPHASVSRYALLPQANFYEFISADQVSEPEPHTVLMDQVQLGKEYELVVTTGVNLNRYRMGDLVRIVSFYNQVPVVEFMQRTGSTLNVRGEKVSETIIYQCLMETTKEFAPKIEGVVDYTCCENVLLDVAGYSLENNNARHILFVEFTTKLSDDELKPLVVKYAVKYDELLRTKQPAYNRNRTLANIEPCHIFPLRSDAFSRLREFLSKTKRVTALQLKVPRPLSSKELVLFLINESII